MSGTGWVIRDLEQMAVAQWLLSDTDLMLGLQYVLAVREAGIPPSLDHAFNHGFGAIEDVSCVRLTVAGDLRPTLEHRGLAAQHEVWVSPRWEREWLLQLQLPTSARATRSLGLISNSWVSV